MNAAGLMAVWDRISDAPDAVGRLRRFVLDLAVRGRLGTRPDRHQAPADPWRPVSRTAQLRDASLEGPYPLPASWAWTSIGRQLDLINGMAFKPSDWTRDGLKIVRIQNLNRADAASNFADPTAVRDRFKIDTGALLLSWSGTPGTSFGAFTWDRGPAVLNQHIFRCDPLTDDYRQAFLKLAINGRLDEMIAKAHGGVGLQHITKGKLEAMLIPLPPKEEQDEVSEKFNELMALCNRLEAARAERENRRDQLVAASFGRLAAARIPDDGPEHFQRRIDCSFYTVIALATRPSHIDRMRQAVRSLAVSGRLLPQGDEDEAASVLLDRIEQPVVRRGTPRVDLFPPFHIPTNWEWIAFGNLLVDGPQNGISPQATTREGSPKAITLSATTSGRFQGEFFKHVEAPFGLAKQFWLQKGDLLFQRGNTREYVGMAAIYDGPDDMFLFPDLIMRVRVSPELVLEYIHLVAVSPYGRSYFAVNATGAQATMPKINQAVLTSFPVPIPPRAEQRRIVAKVFELITLCDSLEAALVAGDEARRALLEATLRDALAPALDKAA